MKYENLNLRTEGVSEQIQAPLGLPEGVSEQIQAPLGLPEGERERLNIQISPTPLNVPEKVTHGYMTASPFIYQRIKEIQDYQKKHSTRAECVLWEYLRNKKTGYKIRRQHIIDRYIVDFVCLKKKLVIEIDGQIHLKQKEYDDFRTTILNKLGFEVIRFTNEDILKDPETAVLQITEKLNNSISTS